MKIASGVKYQLLPSQAQAETLSQWIGCQRFIYNAKVGEDRYFQQFSRKSLSLAGIHPPADQMYSQFISEETSFLRQVPSQILRNGAYRWRTAYQRFFKGLGGRPKFRGKQGRQSVLITKELFGFSPDKNEISLGTEKHPVGRIPFRLHGDRLPRPKSICIARHSGRWWLSFNFTVEHEIEEFFTEEELIAHFQAMPKEELESVAIGFDRGVAIPVAGSDGVKYDFDPATKLRIEQQEKKRQGLQKKRARQQKGSNRQKKTTIRIDKTYAYQGNARKDFAHKVSRKIVDSSFRYFVFEDLKVKNMTKRPSPKLDNGAYVANGARAKAGLNKGILGSAWGNVLRFTQYKGLRRNKLTITIQPSGTSQECSHCGHIHPANRATQAQFVCQRCGLALNADLNASRVIKKRGVDQVGKPTAKGKKPVRVRRLLDRGMGQPPEKARLLLDGRNGGKAVPPEGGQCQTDVRLAHGRKGRRTAKPPLQQTIV